MSKTTVNPTPLEDIKARSDFLRGTLAASLADGASGALAEDDIQISKFHGFYQQDDRDVRDERRRRMLEPDYQFMIRTRVPGGICSPEQWLAMDDLARTRGNGTLRLTTRQALQLHGVLKRDLKGSIRAINDALLDTIAACGDVNRNVMCTPLPEASEIHRQVCHTAHAVSEHLTPRTTAYHEIWLSDGRGRGRRVDSEPIYGDTYLPRKFKIAFAIPPRNDVDVFAHDLGFIAVTGRNGLQGFNIVAGGGMGASHGDPATYPRLGDLLGHCPVDSALAVAEAVVTIQRDHGDRSNRRHARLKYTIDDRGLDWFRAELEQRLGFALAPPRPFTFSSTGDRYGWIEDATGLWHLTLFIENGRLRDDGEARLLSGMRAVAEVHRGEFRLTPNQNVIVSGVADADRAGIDLLVKNYGLDGYRRCSPLRLHSMACVGLPTCPLSMAESERVLPELCGRIEERMECHGLSRQAVVVRITGCPNGCARPYLAEIGLVGKGPGRYNLYLGAAFNGTRLNRLVRETADEDEILALLNGLFAEYAAGRESGESFGDYLLRSGHLDASGELAGDAA